MTKPHLHRLLGLAVVISSALALSGCPDDSELDDLEANVSVSYLVRLYFPPESQLTIAVTDPRGAQIYSAATEAGTGPPYDRTIRLPGDTQFPVTVVATLTAGPTGLVGETVVPDRNALLGNTPIRVILSTP